MKKILKKFFLIAFSRIFKIETRKKILQQFSALWGINLLELAHDANGIMKYQNSTVSGEEFLLKKILMEYFITNNILKPIVFDVGANIGNYSLDVSKILPSSQLYSFEPNPESFKLLQSRTSDLNNVQAYNLGLGSKTEESQIFTSKTNVESEHASIMKDVLLDFHKVEELVNFKISLTTLDQFCKDHEIRKIDFLKVDTEGFELEIFKGALSLIKDKKIDFIQFEFNEMNIIAKVFLKDFYQYLIGYKFYRLDSQKLIPLNDYNTINEIFRFHNIIAVRDEIIISNLA